jgi:hypothetical protein
VTIATLAGVPLLALETVSWRFTQGVRPQQRVFQVTKARANAILEAAPPGREVELRIEGGGRKPLVAKALSVLGVVPGNHPDRVGILVTDRRYWWDRKIVVRRYNVRRRSGEFRLVDGNLERINALPDVTFAKYSLKDELHAWTAKDIVDDVLKEVTEGRYSLGKVDFASALDVDGLELQDDGQSAVKRVLDYIPSLTVYLNQDGIAVLTLTTGGEEGPALADAPPPYQGPHLTIEVDTQRARPSSVEVFFQPEDEVRFDFLEGIASTSSSKEPRLCTNVIPLPDRKLVIAGKTVVQGTWVEINQALLDAWNNDKDNPAVAAISGKQIALPQITFALIQKLWLSPGGYHLFYEIAGGNSVWARRWNAIMRHYRQTFQIPRRWRDRLRSARAERVAIIDPVNARRAPADVFADHCVIPSVKRVAFLAGDTSKKLATNHKAWDDLADSKRLLTAAHLAETALLVPIDEEQMVYHVNFQPDQEGNTLTIVPSILAAKADGAATDIPEADPRVAQALFLLHLAQLSPNHRFTTVLTVASASPQGLGSLHKVVVSPTDAKKMLPSAIARKIGACKGPKYQLFVGANVATARYAWKDEAASEIELSILEGKPRSPSRLLDPEHVGNVAKSMAAIIYALFADRLEGEHVSAIDPDIMPVGRIASVVHDLGRGGALTTRADMPPTVKALDWRALLPESTRRFLFGKVQP